MKLKLSLQSEPKHSELVSCLGWGSSNELFSVGDDHLILKWDFQSDETKQIVTLPPETYATDIHWCMPSGVTSSRRPSVNQSELFVLACTDGKFLLVSRIGRVEKSVEAHKGAVLGARWSGDFTALMTYGEDGAIKVWSRTGMLRTILVQSGSAVYSAIWSPDSDHVLHSSGKTLVIKPLQSGMKPVQWTAHDGLVLCADWSTANNFIVSGGEDRKYKVWDCYGRNMYTSYLHDSPICSVAWAPDGELFAVGAFNTLRLCDKKGWSCSLEKPSTGSVLKIAWTSDGTQFAGACGNGQVVFAQVVDRHLEWHNLEAVVNGDGSIDINNVSNGAREHLDFHDRIVKVSLGWGHLIVTTPAHCYIYNARNWTTPVTVDLKNGAIGIVKQADRHFLIADDTSGIIVMSYEGRLISTIKATGLSSLNPLTIAISVDTIAIRERKDEKNVHLYDAFTGKDLDEGGQPLHHQNDITSLCLSQSGPTHERLLSILDKNNDLFLTSVHGSMRLKVISLGSMVSSICWNDNVNMLAAIQDGKFIVWYHPAVIYSDKDLLPLTQFTKEGSSEVSKSPQLVQFTGRYCIQRRSDGASLVTALSPFPTLLHQHAASANWAAAVRLCRFVQDPALWACLAGMAAGARDLNTAEVAYAAIAEVDKVQYLSYIRELPTAERKNAEMAMFFRQPAQAEASYLQAGMIFRAIQINMNLFLWERALELAVKYKTHVDTVLAYRDRYLKKIESKESLEQYLQLSGKIAIDWDKVKAKVALEEAGGVPAEQ